VQRIERDIIPHERTRILVDDHFLLRLLLLGITLRSRFFSVPFVFVQECFQIKVNVVRKLGGLSFPEGAGAGGPA